MFFLLSHFYNSFAHLFAFNKFPSFIGYFTKSDNVEINSTYKRKRKKDRERKRENERDKEHVMFGKSMLKRSTCFLSFFLFLYF